MAASVFSSARASGIEQPRARGDSAGCRGRGFCAEDTLDGFAAHSRSLGIGDCEISERRGVVFLSFLAAEISLRRSGLRHQGSRQACVDSLCGGGRWMLAGRFVFELSGAARFFAGCGAQSGAGIERGGDAASFARSARARVLGDRDFQPGVFRAAIVVHAGDGAADGFVSESRGRRGCRAWSVSAARWAELHSANWSDICSIMASATESCSRWPEHFTSSLFW